MVSSAVLVVLLVGAASALPQFQNTFAPHAPVPTLKQRTEQFDDAGQYSRSYYLDDGQAVVESGHLKANAENDGLVLIQQGSYQYVTPEGKFVKVEYIADETGFHITNSEGLPVDPAAEALKAQTGFGGNQAHFNPQSKFTPHTQFAPQTRFVPKTQFAPEGQFAPQGLSLPLA